MQAPKKLCLTTHKTTVILGQCSLTNFEQQWQWTHDMKLYHEHSSKCLWVNRSSAIPLHARLAALSDCTNAPAWKCYDTKGTFGLADKQMYLKKQGIRVVIRGDSRYSNWTRYEVDTGGNELLTSLCTRKGKLLILLFVINGFAGLFISQTEFKLNVM